MQECEENNIHRSSLRFLNPVLIHWILPCSSSHKCPFYPMTSTAEGTHEVTQHELVQIARQVIECQVIRVFFEACGLLSRVDMLSELASCLKGTNVKIGLFTDGQVKNKNKLNCLSKIVDVIRVLLCGGCAETHDMIVKNRGSFDDTVRAIRILNQLGVPVEVVMPISRKNLIEIHKCVDLLVLSGVSILRLIPLILPGRLAKEIGVLLGHQDAHQIIEIIAELASRDDINISVVYDDWLLRIRRLSARNVKNFECTIGPDGRVGVIPNVPYWFGSIREHSLRELWQTYGVEAWETAEFRCCLSDNTQDLHGIE